MTEIKLSDIDTFDKNFNADSKNEIVMRSVFKNGIFPSSLALGSEVQDQHTFSLEIPAGDITNQKKSGRCWMFSALNVMRREVMKNLNLKTVELSQAYPLFFDKLEKSNYFLENIIETKDEPVDGRVVTFLLTDPLGDGGQWDMFANLVRKYGVVPKQYMKESFSSSETRAMDDVLTTKLREFATVIRDAAKKGESVSDLRNRKDEMMNIIYRMLCISLGKPPVNFTFEFNDKDGKFVRLDTMTPVEFYEKYVKTDLDETISLINSPTADKPFNKTYTVKFLGNVVGGKDVMYLNLTIDELKQAALNQLKDGKAVWFGSDIGKCADRDSGVMDMNIHNLEGIFSTHFGLTKEQRLDFNDSRMNHAMVINGVNIDENGKPNRWKVENSWGDAPGEKGFFVMSDSWFDQFVYQIVVEKKYLSKEQKNLLEQSPLVLQPWDPMGSLAL